MIYLMKPATDLYRKVRKCSFVVNRSGLSPATATKWLQFWGPTPNSLPKLRYIRELNYPILHPVAGVIPQVVSIVEPDFEVCN